MWRLPEPRDDLAAAIKKLNDPDQGNCSFGVIKLNHTNPARPTKPADAAETPGIKPIVGGA
ncbi:MULTISPECIES: hypothetical protein [unclassified Yoonia]|uniref:hypothetical protein n=1 Tax=unclassified Yoonia TaxID=2629118 RepID=UPI002B001FCC|nr:MULTISPECIES: hypothetical protein [unclassified Yoonia]